VYLKPAGEVTLNDHRRWRLLREGRSEEGVMNAMEDLWNQMQALDAKDPAMKGMDGKCVPGVLPTDMRDRTATR